MSRRSGLLVWSVFLMAGLTLSCGGAPLETTSSADGEQEEPALAEPEPLESLDGSTGGPPVPQVAGDPACRDIAGLPEGVDADASAAELHELGQRRILARDGAGALAILLHAVGKDSKNPSILGDLATALLQCKLFSRAVTRAEEAARLAPGDVDISANLAQTYQIVGRLPDAVEAYRKALEIDPGDAAIHNNLAVLLVLKEPEEAEREARKAVELAPQKATYLVNLGFILFRLERLADAEMVLERACQLEPSNADAYNQLGLVQAAQKDNEKARRSFGKALALDPEHRAARENLTAVEDGFDFTGPWNKKR